MSSQPTQSEGSQYQPGTYAKLNTLLHKHNDMKKEYNSMIAHNEALRFSLDALRADFKKIVAAHKDLSESDMSRRVEVETLRQECDLLKRRNNEL